MVSRLPSFSWLCPSVRPSRPSGLCEAACPPAAACLRSLCFVTLQLWNDEKEGRLTLCLSSLSLCRESSPARRPDICCLAALFTTHCVAVLGSNRVRLLIWSRHSRNALKLSKWLNRIERNASKRASERVSLPHNLKLPLSRWFSRENV